MASTSSGGANGTPGVSLGSATGLPGSPGGTIEHPAIGVSGNDNGSPVTELTSVVVTTPGELRLRRKSSRLGRQTEVLQGKELELLQDVTKNVFTNARERRYGSIHTYEVGLTSSDLTEESYPYEDQKENMLQISKSSLQGAGPDSLMELIVKYHQRMVDLGHAEEAKLIAMSVISALEKSKREGSSAKVAADDDTGLNLYLRDGFLAFMMRLNTILPPPKEQVVKFKKLTYSRNLIRTAKTFPTVGSVLGSCLLPCAQEKGIPDKLFILDDITGYLMPGSLTLVLGPPGCGKSSFHQALSGRLHVDKETHLTGTVSYNHQEIHNTIFRRIAAYIGQRDVHVPTLSVYETCEFARECTTPGIPPIERREAMKDFTGGMGPKMRTEIILNIMGLANARDTWIGDRLRRGVSGGERHRVTTAEMLCGSYLFFCFDEISTGLDSSATFDVVSAIRTVARVRQTTTVFSLLQPAPEVFNLFDRIILLDEGRIVYQGPREDVLPYFASIGYVKPRHVDVADFLQEVTTEAGQSFLAPGKQPLDNDEFVAAYKASKYYQDIVRVVESPDLDKELWITATKPLGVNFGENTESQEVKISNIEEEGSLGKTSILNTTDPDVGDIVRAVSTPTGDLEYIALPDIPKISALAVQEKVEKAKEPARLQLARPLGDSAAPVEMSEYVQDSWESTKTVVRRQFKIAMRNRAFIIARLLQVLILGIFTGTVFYQMDDSPQQQFMDLRKSIAFIAMLAMALGALPHINNQVQERQVFYKQHDARFFRGRSYVLACTLAGIPFSIMEIVIYCPLIYFLTGLSLTNGGAHFFIFVLLVFVLALVIAALVRLLTTVAKTAAAAQGIGGLLVVLMLLFSGFLIVKNKIPPWWIWMYWASPLQWGLTAVVLNEFLSGKYDMACSSVTINSQTAFCRGKLDKTVAEAYLELYKFPTSFSRVWINFAVLLGYYVLFVALTFYATSQVQHPEIKTPPPPRIRSTEKPPPPPSVEDGVSPLSPSKSEPKLKILRSALGQNEDQAEFDAHFVSQPRADVSSHEPLPAGGVGHRNVAKASGLAFMPITLSFHDITYEIRIPGFKERKVLLNRVSGFAKPGTMTALMGSSGAGKTTLLDVLAGRKTVGYIKGEILVNAYPKKQTTFARVMGYCEQNDIHTPYQSVHEALLFSANLRLHRSTTPEQRRNFVAEVMDLLELWPIANDLVGFIGESGISIEQAKRLTIGVELVSNPSVLFLDEPTSGLDSRAAQRVIKGIRNIVATGRSVICTIHQPSQRLFMAFDDLLLLKRGGEVVFFGPLGEDFRSLLGFFESLPGVRKCRDDQNPANYMLEVIGAGIGHAAVRDFAMDYKNSDLWEQNSAELERLRYSKGSAGPEATESGFAAPITRMFWKVVRRHLISYWRNVPYSFGRIVFSIILGLLLGTVFLQIKYDTLAGVASRAGMIYIAIVFYSIVNANGAIPQVNAERAVYYREQAAQMYPRWCYNVAWTAAEIPYLCVSSLIFCSIAFTLAGVATDSAAQFFLFLFIFWLYATVITFFGIFLAFVTPNAESAAVIVPVIISIWNITSGFMISRQNIPAFWSWLYWLNPTQYALNGLSAIAFYCDQGGPCSPLNCPTSAAACPDCSCTRLKDANNIQAWPFLRDGKDLDYGRRWADVGVLVAFVVLFRFLAQLGLQFASTNKR